MSSTHRRFRSTSVSCFKRSADTLPIRIWTRKIHMCTRRSSSETHWFVGPRRFYKREWPGYPILHSKLSTDGTSAVVDINDIKRSWHCSQVSMVDIYTLLKKAHVESGSALSVLDWVDEAAKHSQMCFYWKMILNFEVLLLIYMRSIREGNFELYLALLYRILSWFFALDRYNYGRRATIYWFEMEFLKHRRPNEYKEFATGNFSFLKTNKPFSRMGVDQLHEENNKYIKNVSGATSLLNRQYDSA